MQTTVSRSRRQLFVGSFVIQAMAKREISHFSHNQNWVYYEAILLFAKAFWLKKY